MNNPAPFIDLEDGQAVAAPNLWTDEARAFFSLAMTQRRFAHEYKRWALEAEAAGKLKSYHKYRTESNRLWRDAKAHLRWTRRHINA